MNKIELEIVALSHSVTQSHNYAVVLGEQKGKRRLPIVIGAFEAQAIAVAMERMAPNRPLTHDLFKNTMDTFDVVLKEVVINDLVDGIFYAKLVCFKEGELYEVDSRTSDAIAMAVRFGCPIYTHDFIMDSAGVELEPVEKDAKGEGALVEVTDGGTFGNYSIEELETMLGEVLEDEDYEKAAKIRDEIQRRKQEGS